MPDLLLEFFSEEIPARMQSRAAEDLKKLVTDKLVEAGLTYEGAKAFATPRRLTLAVAGIPVRQPDVKEEKKGPRVGAPEQAISGFLKSAGLSSIDQAKVEKDSKKGEFYVAVIEKTGRPAIDVIAEMIPAITMSFPWPKSMTWGEPDFVVTDDGSYVVDNDGNYVLAEPWLKWVRPLHAIVATFGPETEEPEIVKFKVGRVVSGDTTYGHRFLAPAPIKVKRFDDYMAKLEKAKVVVDPTRRAQIILTDAKNLAFAQGFELVEDEGLLAEVSGLVEWPVALMGSFDADFLAIPEEVIRATIRNNQKCFVVRDQSTAKLANKFILVSNIEATDGGKAIVAGNERVIRARLSDAKFFYEADLRQRLEDRLPKFEHIVFHEKLGTQAERIERIVALAGHLAPIVGADVTKAKRAAQLCKADLQTEVVGEFPEVQGLMGRYYAETQGEDEAIAHAIEDHYKPKGPDDLVPAEPVSIAVALADRIDILAGFWAIDEKPTGSKDPYALRRAALGVIRLILQNNIRLKLSEIVPVSMLAYLIWGFHPVRDINHGGYDDLVGERPDGDGVSGGDWHSAPYRLYLNHDGLLDREGELIGGAELSVLDDEKEQARGYAALKELRERLHHMETMVAALDFGDEELRREGLLAFFESRNYDSRLWRGAASAVFSSLHPFFADRLKVQLREQGARHDLVDAVFALQGQDDLVMIVRRIEALAKFLDTDDGKNLLAGTKRAANILRIEERKDKLQYTEPPDAALLQQDEEKELAKAINGVRLEADLAIVREDFAAAMAAIAKLRPFVDAFFDKVTVNVDDVVLRANRLRLLNEIRVATLSVADFSKIEG